MTAPRTAHATGVVRPRAAGGPLAAVRAATAQAHARLDSSLDVLDRPWGPQGHRRWLELTHGLLAPLEARLARWAALDPGFPDVAVRARADLALADLRTLDPAAAVPPPCPGLPAVEDRPSALGVLYVLDGSTLGGRLVRDAVLRAGIPAAACTSFTGREGAGRRWRETTAALDAVPAVDVPAVADSAVATFAAFERWLGPLRSAATTGEARA